MLHRFVCYPVSFSGFYLIPFAEKPKVFAPVLGQQVHGAFGGAEAGVRGRPVDGLAEVLKVEVSWTLKAGLVLFNYNHGVLQ